MNEILSFRLEVRGRAIKCCLIYFFKKNHGKCFVNKKICLTLHPIRGKTSFQTGKYQSGQMGQTVNLLAYAFGGSNPSLPTNKVKAFLFNVAEVAQSIEH